MSNYVVITKEEFENGLRSIQRRLSYSLLGEIVPIQQRGTWEYVYQFDTPERQIKLLIYSSVDINTGKSRSIGSDAIRCVAVYRNQEIFRGTRHTKRMTKWREHLYEKILQLLEGVRHVPNCPKCGNLMIQRKSKHGLFWGCSEYPTCNGTRRI